MTPTKALSLSDIGRKARWRVVEDQRKPLPFLVQRHTLLGWRTEWEHAFAEEAVQQCQRLASFPRVIHEEE
jgi:hypothetical protein